MSPLRTVNLKATICASEFFKLIGRAAKLGEQIDLVYAGRPFLPDVGPTAPANRRRFNGYYSQLRKQTNLLLKALTLWRICYGVDTGELFACAKLPGPPRISACKGKPQASDSPRVLLRNEATK
jgi:hypothetical protein